MVIEAYNKHCALIIRPDDVWLAILTQFSFFVNGNAEALHSTFMAHKGKWELVVISEGTRYNMNPAHMAHQMTGLMQKHINDPSLREWIMPNFTTITTLDKMISAVVMMGTMKEFFSYKFVLWCGIPKVTLEGEKSDWEEILRCLERLKMYDIQTTAWYHLLQPIISRFIATYDDPNSPGNRNFWSKVAHWSGGRSGPSWLSGWITAFCVFDEKGRWQGDKFVEEQHGDVNNASDHSQLSAKKFASTYIRSGSTQPCVTLDGFPYPSIDSNDIPCGSAHIDVKLNDNGELFDTMFVAGLVGMQICFAEKTKPSANSPQYTVQPFPAWWYFIKGG